MKKIILFAAAAAMLLVGCQNAKTYAVTGEVEGLEGTVALIPMSGNADEPYGEAEVVDGKFAIEVESLTPLFTLLSVNGEPAVPVFLEKGEISVSGNAEDLQSLTVGGTVSNDAFAAYVAAQNALAEQMQNPEVTEEQIKEVYEQIEALNEESYEANKDNLWGAYILVMNKYYSMEAEDILATVAAFPKELQSLPELVKLKGRAEGMLRTSVGNDFIDVKMPDAEGKEIALSDVVKANKVVLLDFWASWCRPCMGEVPYLVADYAKYHDKGFEIYGISLDNNKEAWTKTIADKGMNWVNVSILGGWEAPAVKDYAVSSIPSNFLIDSEGKIIAKNLRGEALGEKLAEIFE